MTEMNGQDTGQGTGKMTQMIRSVRNSASLDESENTNDPYNINEQPQDPKVLEREYNFLVEVLKRLPDLPDPFNIALFVMEQFRQRFGCYPDVLNPVTFNEKIQARKFFDRRPILGMVADKLAVRDYVSERVGPEFLPRLYHATSDPLDIPFESLPDRYVVKATHGSGWVKLVKDHANRDECAIVTLCQKWLALNYYDLSFEWNYKHIPRRIIVEEFLDNGAGESANDYKLFTFNGRVEYIQVDIGRFTNHKKNFYDRHWNPVALRQEADNFSGVIAPPTNLDALVRCAEALAQGLDFSRVDLYSVNDRVYFGELTMMPGGGFFRFDPPEFDERFGRLWRMEISSLGALYSCSSNTA
jgi:hypothetical protein